MKTNKINILREWQKRAKEGNEECVKCGRKYYLTVDHIIPEHFLLQLNLKERTEDWEENYEIICGACNGRKGGRIDISHPKTYNLLRKAIQMSEDQLK